MDIAIQSLKLLWQEWGKERRRIFWVIHGLALKYDPLCVSQKKVTKISKYSLKTVKRVISDLKENGLLEVKRRRRKCAIYTLKKELLVTPKDLSKDLSKDPSRILRKPNIDKASEGVKRPDSYESYNSQYVNTHTSIYCSEQDRMISQTNEKINLNSNDHEQKNESISFEQKIANDLDSLKCDDSLKKSMKKFSIDVVAGAIWMLQHRREKLGDVDDVNKYLNNMAKRISRNEVDPYEAYSSYKLPQSVWSSAKSLCEHFPQYAEGEIINALGSMNSYGKFIENKTSFFHTVIKNNRIKNARING